jgi:hypothetical protein
MSVRTFERLRDERLGCALWNEMRGLYRAAASDVLAANFFHRCVLRERGVRWGRELQR